MTHFESLSPRPSRGAEGTLGVVIDRVRRITYPLALVAFSVLSPHGAEAAEIPEHMTWSEGVGRLRAGALSDRVETKAEYVSVEGKGGVWISTEGGIRSVSTSYADELAHIRQAAGSIGARVGETLTVRFVHTHPTHSALHVGFGSLSIDRPVSVPPSNGFASVGGDTSAFKSHQLETEVRIPLEAQTGMRVRFEEGIVDSLGMWSYSQMTDQELASAYPEIAAENQRQRDIIVMHAEMAADLERKRVIIDYVASLAEHEIDVLLEASNLSETGTKELALYQEMTDSVPRMAGKRDIASSCIVGGLVDADFITPVPQIEEYRVISRRADEVGQSIESVRLRINENIRTWARESQVQDMHKLVTSNIYKALQEAYAHAKVRIAYEPFAD